MELKFLLYVLFKGILVSWTDGENTNIKAVDVTCEIFKVYLIQSGCNINMSASGVTNATQFNITNIHEAKNANILYLDSGSLEILPIGLCLQFPVLHEFTCTGKDLKLIRKEYFLGGNELTSITFYRNKLEKVPTNLCAYAHNVMDLTFEGNRISEIEPGAFNGTDNLENLNFVDNLLTKIEQNTFAGVGPNLVWLDLEGNRIEVIDDGALNFPKLKNLYLSRNCLKVLSDHLFSGVPAITNIDLAKNNISLVNRSLDSLSKLSVLDLSGNKVNDFNIRAQARKLESLRVRDIGLKLEDLVSPMNEAYSVRILDISCNNLAQPDILRYLKNFVHVTDLYLENNNISAIKRFGKIPKIFPELLTLRFDGNNTNELGPCRVSYFQDESTGGTCTVHLNK